MRSKIVFLTLSEVLELHQEEIVRYGGVDGIRDIHLLESAVSQPEATFGGVYLHEDLFHMAAAYTFHLAQNHPFLDGNKRTALAAGLVFLRINNQYAIDHERKLIEVMLQVASGKMSKEELAKVFRKLAKKI